MPVRVGVIGVGHLGRHHARIYSELEGVELAAIIDSDIKRAGEIADQYGAKAYADYRDALGGLQALSIVTPTSSHYQIALDCIKEGKDLLVEKPITTTVAEADELIEEADKRGLVLQIGHLERYNPAVVAVAGHIKEPVFFEAERVSPFLGRATDVHATIDLMIHDIDLISGFLNGAGVSAVRAKGLSLVTDKIDFAEAWIEFSSGAAAVIKASRVAEDTRRFLTVYQPGSLISVDYKDRKAKEFIKTSEGWTGTAIDVIEAEPLKEELKDFIRRLGDRKKPLVSGVEGRDALRVANMITDAIINERRGR